MKFKINLMLFMAVMITLFSCNNGIGNNQQTNTIDTILADESNNELGVVSEAGGGAEKVNLPNEFEEDAVMLSLENYFTQDEVDQYKKLGFYGLFYDSISTSYNLRKTPTSFIETGIQYDDGRTSFECGVPIKENEACLFLFSNHYMTKDLVRVKNLLAEPRFFKADEMINFTSNGFTYTLSASDYLVEPNGSQTHMDYKLMLNARVQNAASTETLLSFIPWFDDGAVTVLFIGDLDGDSHPDYIIDNASKYTGVSTSGVFYSTKASNLKGLPKPISQQVMGSIGKQEHNGEFGC
jgi:hypothetical protein